MNGFRTRRLVVLSLVTLASLIASAQSVVQIPNISEPAGIAVDPYRNLTYVGNNSDPGGLTVINGQKVVKNIPITGRALVVAVNLTNHRIYVGVNDYTNNQSSVWVFDGHSYELLATIPVSTASSLGIQGIGVDPIRNRIYVSDEDCGALIVIDGKTNQVTGSLSLPGAPSGVAVNYRTQTVYVAVQTGVSVVDARTLTQATFVSTPLFSSQLAVNTTWNLVYVINAADSSPGHPGTLIILDGKTNTIIRTPETGTFPHSVDIDILSGRVYVVNRTDLTLGVYDRNGNLLQTTNLGGETPDFVAVNPVTGAAYVSDGVANVVDVVSRR